MNVPVCTHVCVHCMCAHVCMYVHSCMYLCVLMCMHVCTVCMSVVCMSIAHECVLMCALYVHVCMCSCVCSCVCIVYACLCCMYVHVCVPRNESMSSDHIFRGVLDPPNPPQSIMSQKKKPRSREASVSQGLSRGGNLLTPAPSRAHEPVTQGPVPAEELQLPPQACLVSPGDLRCICTLSCSKGSQALTASALPGILGSSPSRPQGWPECPVEPSPGPNTIHGASTAQLAMVHVAQDP